ncbi:MAG: ABC transporter ATP-binding protein [Candidatus Aminicenantes bacterium]|nr:ABC transporter ATP-binding protein [Candidatus Aminicenantes bacterium]
MRQNSENLIRLQNVCRSYRLGKTVVPALREVALEIGSKDFCVIAGPSGSGKTSLLNLAGLVDKPDKGKIWWDGRDITPCSLNSLFRMRRDRIGYIFQTFNLIPVLSVFENVEYPLLLCRIHRKKRREIVDAVLEEVGLYERKKHKPKELSGGERQRVSIARAVVKNPDVVLADEPTANLDSVTGKKILDLMFSLHLEKGIAFVFSSHDPRIFGMGKKLVRLRDGIVENIEEN